MAGGSAHLRQGAPCVKWGHWMKKCYELRDYLPIYAGALAFVGLLVIAAHFTIDRIAGEQKTAARMVEMAGTQRMLSQRAASLTLEYVTTEDLAQRVLVRAMIDEAHAEMKTTHLALTQGNLSLGIPVAASEAIDDIYFGEPHLLDQRVRLFMYDIREILSKTWDTDLENSVYAKSIVQESRQALLEPLDDATDQFMTNSMARVEKLRIMMKIMHGIVIVAIICIGFFVFTPLFRRVVRQSESLADAAHTDALTGGPNRRGFMVTGSGEFSRALRHGAAMSVMVLDIDHFKSINDSLGHAAGDQVIRNLAETCMRTLRKSDTFGRLGGEEFGILLPETHLEEALQVAEKLREILANTSVHRGGSEIHFTVSIGVAERMASDDSLEALLGRADIRMFAAKNAGRNRVISCENEMTVHTSKPIMDALPRDRLTSLNY